MKAQPREEVIKLDPVAVRYITAARMLEISESTVRKLEKKGKLKTTLVGADRRVTVASIRALLRRGARPAAA